MLHESQFRAKRELVDIFPPCDAYAKSLGCRPIDDTEWAFSTLHPQLNQFQSVSLMGTVNTTVAREKAGN